MTADIIQMKEQRGPRLRRAIEDWYKASEMWVDKTLELAIELKTARDECGGDDRAFGHWLVDNECEVGPKDREALIKMGTHIVLTRQILQETSRRSVQHIWVNEIAPKLIYAHVSVDAPEPNSIPEPLPAPVVEPEIVETVSENHEKPTRPTYEIPKKSKLAEKIGDEAATVLHQNFKHARMFNAFIGEGKQHQVCATLRYLARVCVQDDYPIELLSAQKWSLKLLYPHLPDAMLIRFASKITSIGNDHATLVETEKRFRLTPEFGVLDPPMIAPNKAYAIYNSIKHAKKGATVDPAAYHKPTYAGDEGKPPVIIRGTQVWPAEEGEGYSYNDLRCACGFAGDVVKTFDDTRGAPMSTRSLKLRHLMSWIDGGYNAKGSTTAGMLKALRSVIQAYSSDRSEVMQNPLPSMVKNDE